MDMEIELDGIEQVEPVNKKLFTIVNSSDLKELETWDAGFYINFEENIKRFKELNISNNTNFLSQNLTDDRHNIINFIVGNLQLIGEDNYNKIKNMFYSQTKSGRSSNIKLPQDFSTAINEDYWIKNKNNCAVMIIMIATIDEGVLLQKQNLTKEIEKMKKMLELLETSNFLLGNVK